MQLQNLLAIHTITKITLELTHLRLLNSMEIIYTHIASYVLYIMLIIQVQYNLKPTYLRVLNLM